MKLSEGAKTYESALKLSLRVIILLALFAIIKLASGYFLNSLVLMADGMHSLMDFIILLASYFSVKLMLRKPSEKFPYGYYRVEDFVVLLISIIFIITSISLIIEGFKGVFLRYRPPKMFFIAFIIALITALGVLVASHAQEKIAIKTNVQSLLLSSKELKYDSIITLMVAISIISSAYLLIPLEHVMTIILGLLILRLGFSGGKDSLMNLLDMWNKPEIVNRIRQIVEKHGLKIKRIRLRKTGPVVYGDCGIIAPSTMRVSRLNELINLIKTEIRNSIPEVHEITIYPSVVEAPIRCIAIPVVVENEHIYVSERFGRAKKLALYRVDLSSQKISFLELIDNPFTQAEHAGVKLSKVLLEKNIDTVIVKNIGEAAFIMLQSAGIKIYRASKSSLTETLNDFLSGILPELKQPTVEGKPR